MLSRAWLAAALLVVSALGACGNGDDDADVLPSPLAIETPAPGAEIRIHAAEVAIEIRGAIEVDVHDTARVQVTEILGEGTPQATWFLQVGFAEPVFLEEHRLFHVGFDLAPGLYRGAGTYELSEEGASPIEGSGGLASGVIIRLSELAEGTHAEFGRFVAPCSLEVTQKAIRGEVDCPELADEEGRSISLAMSWTLVEQD